MHTIGICILFRPFAMTNHTTQHRPENNLKRFRVLIESADYFDVDVLAENAAEAMERGEHIDPEFVRHRNRDGRYEATDVWEVSAEEFSPPDLPASSWIAG